MDNKLKGISLPIETIVVIVVCILILVIVILFFGGGFNRPAGEITLEGQLRTECNEWGRDSGYQHDAATYMIPEAYPALQAKYPPDETGAIQAKKFCTGRE
ncbi:MAG: hypothetical protein DRP06_01605 [Candidatus Aenigmatarchaeota archaeon]|nr:MAG: hypothetical protein DRP06_01605 [Candidatus Aenigmarchaeota archaeon]